ncbi:MAG: hypothetical protein ACL7BU_00980 [Candidatus Phlomobacter fragariae]
MNYRGLVITDVINMGAVANNFDNYWVVKQAILAGNDIILMSLKITDIDDETKLEQLYHYLKMDRKEILN